MPTIKINLADSTEYRSTGILHREDGPAVEYPSGTRIWYVHGIKVGHIYAGYWIEWYICDETLFPETYLAESCPSYKLTLLLMHHMKGKCAN